MVEPKTIITHTHPKSPISEAYRVLRTNIQFTSVDKPLKIIVITSSGPGEGKSTTITNLAITFAQSGSKVLLMDGDLRRPKIHKMFTLFNSKGVTNVLAQHDDYKLYLQKGVIDNLDVMTAGPIPPNPSELLASNSMKEFLETVRQDYDVVLIDAPPVGTVTDAAILSTIADGTILVVSSGEVEIGAAQMAKELLEKVKANIIGVVLNKLKKNEHGNSYYHYYYYYGEDDDNNNKKKRKKKTVQISE